MPAPKNDRGIVYIVDDDAPLREALADLFATVSLDAKVYATAGAFLGETLVDRPGCVVTDIRLPDMNGLDFQARLAEGGVGLPVVVMTGFGDIPMSVRAMKRGAVDFLSKPFNDQDMLDAVLVAIERDRDRRKAQEGALVMQERFQKLSAREREVMLLVTSGKMNKQVAGDLGISEITVKIHRGSAMRKMQARTLPDLVRMVELIRPSRA